MSEYKSQGIFINIKTGNDAKTRRGMHASFFELDGKLYTISQIADMAGKSKNHAYDRIVRGAMSPKFYVEKFKPKEGK